MTLKTVDKWTDAEKSEYSSLVKKNKSTLGYMDAALLIASNGKIKHGYLRGDAGDKLFAKVLKSIGNSYTPWDVATASIDICNKMQPKVYGEKTMNKNTFEVEEDFQVPGTNVVLERGDKFEVLNEDSKTKFLMGKLILFFVSELRALGRNTHDKAAILEITSRTLDDLFDVLMSYGMPEKDIIVSIKDYLMV